MKLRIKDQSIRFRLSQSEVAQLHRQGSVGGACRLGLESIGYRLLATSEEAVRLEYRAGHLTVYLPAAQLDTWAGTDAISMRHHVAMSDGPEVALLVEKDFQCLTDRPHEDESDLYRHPRAGDLEC